MVASDVVPFDAVVVDVVEHGQALAAGLGLGTAGQGPGGVGPVAGAGADGLGATVLPGQSAHSHHSEPRLLRQGPAEVNLRLQKTHELFLFQN